MNSQISILSHRRPALAALLIVLSSASAVLAQVNNVQFKGAFDGRATGAVQDGSLLLNSAGAGTAVPIGRFTYTAKSTVELANGRETGDIQLVAANGDVINGVLVGLGTPTGTANLTHVTELVTITGGTGRFQGATGNLTLDFLDDNTSRPIGLTSGSLRGTISTPGSTN
jgi:hypothetical protein